MAGGTQSPMSGEHQCPPPDRGSVIVCRMRFSRKSHTVICQLHFIRSIVPRGQPRNLITNLSGLYLPSQLPSATTGNPGFNHHHHPILGSCPTSSQVPWPLQATLQTTTTAYLPKNRPAKCGILDGTLEHKKSRLPWWCSG